MQDRPDARVIAAGKRLMGLDVGKKTIGLATCDAGWRVWRHRIRSCGGANSGSTWQNSSGSSPPGDIGGLVVGWPVEMNGSEGPRCDSVRDFTHAMLRWRREADCPGLPVTFYDERLSTQAAERAMLEADMTRNRRAQKRDALAAAWILQGFIDGFRLLFICGIPFI